MDADCGVAGRWVLRGNGDGVLRFEEVRAGYHHLRAADGDGAGDDVGEVILVGLFGVVYAAVYGVGEVDAYLMELEVVREGKV